MIVDGEKQKQKTVKISCLSSGTSCHVINCHTYRCKNNSNKKKSTWLVLRVYIFLHQWSHHSTFIYTFNIELLFEFDERTYLRKTIQKKLKSAITSRKEQKYLTEIRTWIVQCYSDINVTQLVKQVKVGEEDKIK